MNEDTFGEYLGDVQTLAEMEAITEMLRVAAEHGLEGEIVREVILRFNPGAGVGIEQACINALVEWDL